MIASSDIEGSVIPEPNGGYLAELTDKEKELIFAANVYSVEAVVVAEKTVEVADLALTLVAKAKMGEKIREADANAYQAILSDAAKIYDESIIAIVRPTERLLKHLTQ